MRIRSFAAVLLFAASFASGKAGPLAVGDPVDVTFGGQWQRGTVTYVEGLTYFVHWGEESDHGKFDAFQQLYRLRPAGGDPKSEKTFADVYHDKTPDPAGGPVAIGETVEANIDGWIPCRVVRRLGERYVVFPENPTVRYRKAEAWIGMEDMRPAGSTKPFSTKPTPKPAQPKEAKDVHIGDVVESYKRGGYGWFQATVMAIDHGRYYVQAGPDSSMKGWVALVHMRAVGSTKRFEAEDLAQFTGEWNLAGDAFFTTAKTVDKGDHIEKTMVLNSGAGQDAGHVKINPDGTYVLTKTAVYRDGVPGKWIRNPDESEGGILLQDGEKEGKDLLVTPHPDKRIYLQSSFRGPGKIGTHP